MNDQIEKLLDSIDVNPKIRELAKESGCSIDKLGYGEGNLEKFAELIVKECMKICQNHPSIIFKNEWDADVVSPDIVSRLESHFGVEE